MSETLFPVPQAEPDATTPSTTKAAPRMQRANRDQILLQPSHLESLLAPDHRARVIWGFVRGLDLSSFHERILAREGHGGRPPFDPAVILTLWVFATTEAVGSARLLERLCGEHDAYRWICGGLTINHHTLSDFRNERAAEVDELMTQIVGLLMEEKLVTMERVAQDGVKVRAAAGAPSFRRKESLELCLEEARGQVGTADAKETYKERAATAECVNAIARNRGLRQFLVRGIPKCLAVLTLFALAHNVMRAVHLLAAGA